MSYFEDISKYSEDLSAQRDNFSAMAARTKERLSAENQEKFNELTQRFEMIGGAVSAAAMGAHGFAKSIGEKGKGLNFEEQSAKLQAKIMEENPEFSDFLSDARGRFSQFGSDFSSKMGGDVPIPQFSGGDGTTPGYLTAKERRPMGVSNTAEVSNKAFDSTAFDADGSIAQDAYTKARGQLLDPSLRTDAPDPNTTPRGTKLVGPGQRVKAADIYASDGRLAYPGPKQMMPRGNIGSSVANAGAKDSSLMGASLHPEVDGAGQLIHNNPSKGLTLDAQFSPTARSKTTTGFHNADELKSVNARLRTGKGIETGRIPPNYDPVFGTKASQFPDNTPKNDADAEGDFSNATYDDEEMDLDNLVGNTKTATAADDDFALHPNNFFGGKKNPNAPKTKPSFVPDVDVGNDPDAIRPATAADDTASRSVRAPAQPDPAVGGRTGGLDPDGRGMGRGAASRAGAADPSVSTLTDRPAHLIPDKNGQIPSADGGMKVPGASDYNHLKGVQLGQGKSDAEASRIAKEQNDLFEQTGSITESRPAHLIPDKNGQIPSADGGMKVPGASDYNHLKGKQLLLGKSDAEASSIAKTQNDNFEKHGNIEGEVKAQNVGGPKFENVKPSIGEGDLSFANKGNLLKEGEDVLQSTESAALGDTRALAQSKNTIGAFVEGLGAEEGAATGIEAAAAAGGAMEMASGAGEVIGAGILVAGVLHDVLQKPESAATNIPNTGKIGFNPDAIAGSMSGGGSGIA
tara:strand:- start:2195 stop:4429 length:2235 start_codon:yes stop_codon:yes gene_type:complete